MEEGRKDQLWHFRENTANKFTPQPIIEQTTRAPSYSSLGHRMWTKVRNLGAERDFQRQAGTI